MSVVYSFIIVEDVVLQREYFIDLLYSWLDLWLFWVFDNVEDVYFYFFDSVIFVLDFIFLDIEMFEASGFNFLEVI